MLLKYMILMRKVLIKKYKKLKYNSFEIKSEKDALSEKPNKLKEFDNLNKKNKIRNLNINSSMKSIYQKKQIKEKNY